MKKTKDQVQEESVKVLKKNNYIGTVSADTGVGKCKIGIDCIKEGRFKNILITSPRTNLKENWQKELDKWGQGWLFGDTHTITIANIQTCYKWTEKELQQFDLIILDEIHTIATPEYGLIMEIADRLEISRIGLTATLDTEKNEEKQKMYDKYCPVVYKYHTAAKDGLINKRKYKVVQYSLSNKHMSIIKTPKKLFKQGEKDRYEYLDSLMKTCRDSIQNYYFNEVRGRAKEMIAELDNDAYKEYIKKLTSEDLKHFRDLYWADMKAKNLPYDLYKAMRYIAGKDYARTGMKAGYYAGMAPPAIKTEFFKYIWARNERKKFLCSLDSSKDIAVKLKHKILKNKKNKVLLFSELTDQAEKLSPYSIHSNQKDEVNAQMLEEFNKGNIREMSSVRSLILGLNLRDPNYAIMESYNSSATQFKQKSGRTDRLDVNKIATVIWVVPKNTQAEEWFWTANKDVNEENIEFIDLDKVSIDELSI